MIRSNPVLLVGGAPFDATDLDLATKHIPRLIAVDGGANSLSIETKIEALVGDLDSVTDLEIWREHTQVVELSDQNKTDFEKAVTFSKSDKIVGLGFIGGRFDQTLTSLHVLSLFDDKSFLLFSEEDIIVSLPIGVSSWHLKQGERVSLYPLSPCRFKSSDGLLYPLDGLEMAQGKLIGTSNSATKPNVQINMKSGSCLLIFSKIQKEKILQDFLSQTS